MTLILGNVCPALIVGGVVMPPPHMMTLRAAPLPVESRRESSRWWEQRRRLVPLQTLLSHETSASCKGTLWSRIVVLYLLLAGGDFKVVLQKEPKCWPNELSVEQCGLVQWNYTSPAPTSAVASHLFCVSSSPPVSFRRTSSLTRVCRDTVWPGPTREVC